jgi:hypothetical protein
LHKQSRTFSKENYLGRLYSKFLDGVFTCLVAIAELEFFKNVYPPAFASFGLRHGSSGAPILPDLLRYQALAVNEYGCALDALHLRQTGRLQDSGIYI